MEPQRQIGRITQQDPLQPFELVTQCTFCLQEIPWTMADKYCPHCGKSFRAPKKSNFLAFVLGLLLGPVGLWYKRHWAAGFAWFAMCFVFGVAVGPDFAVLITPFLALGMAIHASVVDPKP